MNTVASNAFESGVTRSGWAMAVTFAVTKLISCALPSLPLTPTLTPPGEAFVNGSLAVTPLSRPSSSAIAFQCPSILMFDGVNIANGDVSESKAKYWGEYIGISGFLLNNVMSSWQDAVADNENRSDYQRLKRFQQLYSRYGVTENFIKVAIYKPVDWKSSSESAATVDNFRRLAHLARFAGVRGIALDLEPYAKGLWDSDTSDPDKPDRIYNMGKEIGNVIEQAYPASPVFVIREVLWWQNRASNYALSGRFWEGLMASSVPRLYMGEELTYDESTVPDELRMLYRDNALRNHVDPKKVEIEPALWPLGKTYFDKSARMPPNAFYRQLQNAFAQHPQFVWIYGFGSAWETNGPYGHGEVVANFREYVAALHRVKEQCSNHHGR